MLAGYTTENIFVKFEVLTARLLNIKSLMGCYTMLTVKTVNQPFKI